MTYEWHVREKRKRNGFSHWDLRENALLGGVKDKGSLDPQWPASEKVRNLRVDQYVEWQS